MRRWSLLAIVFLGLVFSSSRAYSQANTFPATGNAGIGTLTATGAIQSALQILYSGSTTDTAMLRFTDGSTTTSTTFGTIGLMPTTGSHTYSSFSNEADLVIHEHSQGDLILTNFQSYSLSHPYGAIRMATTPSAASLPTSLPTVHDFERISVMPNGNVGINIPPNTSGSSAGLDSVVDQLQIGGGTVILPGEVDPLPGLTLYGGNRFEGLPTSSNLYPADWRYISFNNYLDHSDSSINHIKRPAHTASAGISFSDFQQGTLQLWAEPYDAGHSNNRYHSMTLNLTGQNGLSLWQYNDSSATVYHHLFDVLPPGDTAWPLLRNPNGAFIHHTPVYITSDSTSTPSANFMNFSVHPSYGDDSTWMLAVNGPMLAKEFYMSIDFPDYVFDPEYKLMSLGDLKEFINENHHLPDVPSAKQIDSTGMPVGKTEAKMMQKIEELTRYILQQQDEIEQLNSKVLELENKEEK